MTENLKPKPPQAVSPVSKADEWPKAPFTRPKSWAEITRGSLVVAFESEDDGWWDAVIISVSGDDYTLFFRDFAHQGRHVRKSSQLALLKP